MTGFWDGLPASEAKALLAFHKTYDPAPPVAGTTSMMYSGDDFYGDDETSGCDIPDDERGTRADRGEPEDPERWLDA